MTSAVHYFTVTALAVVFAAVPTRLPATGTAAPDFSRPRDLPSMVTRWQSPGAACAVLVGDGTAYILRSDGVEARATAGGRVLWQAKVPPGECRLHGQNPLRVIDKRILAGFRDRLLVLDRSSGQLERTIPLGGYLTHLAGSPVVVAVGHQGGEPEILSLDIDTGAVRARRTVVYAVRDLISAGGTVVALWREDNVDTVFGLDPKDLSERWRSTSYSGVTEEAGTVYATGPDDDCDCDTRFSVIDPASGRAVERRPRRAPDHNNTTAGLDLPWDLQFVGPEHPYFDLRRNRREDGKPQWTAQLPGALRAWAVQGDALFAHVQPGGRGLLLEMDWNTGTIRRGAYGLPSVHEMAAAGDVLILQSEDGVTAVSSRDFGPPEAVLHPAAEEARRILAGPIGYATLALQGELMALGPEALPVITDLIPTLGPDPLSVAAAVVAQAGHRPAAAGLADRLASLEATEWEPGALPAVLDALARIGGGRQVPAVAAVLADSARPAFLRFSAFTTLASIGTPEAVAALEAAVKARPAAARSAWPPPSPGRILPLLGQEIGAEAIQGLRDRLAVTEAEDLARARSAARIALGPGRSLVVFPADALGDSRDLWAAEVDASGRLRRPAVFLGVRSPGPFSFDGMPIRARLEGTRLEIQRSDGEREMVRADMSDAQRDTDGDGVPDLAEQRLLLDPKLADTDGDGLSDAVDPVPNAVSVAKGEEADAAIAFFEQYFGIYNPEEAHRAVLVVSDRALRHYGRPGPTLVLTAKEADRLADQAKRDDLWLPPRLRFEPEGEPLHGQERAFAFSSYSGPLNAAGYAVVMRKIGERWYVRSFVRTMIS